MFSGARLRKIREEKRYTMAALAKETGLHWVSISVYERGKQEPGANALRKIALALGVSMDDFFEDNHVKPRPLGVIVDKIRELAKEQGITLPKSIYPLFLFQETLGIEDNEVFTHVLLALARGKVIELIPVFSCDIKEGMKVYQIPDLGSKKYYSFTIINHAMPEPEQGSAVKARRRTKKGGR